MTAQKIAPAANRGGENDLEAQRYGAAETTSSPQLLADRVRFLVEQWADRARRAAYTDLKFAAYGEFKEQLSRLCGDEAPAEMCSRELYDVAIRQFLDLARL